MRRLLLLILSGCFIFNANAQYFEGLYGSAEDRVRHEAEMEEYMEEDARRTKRWNEYIDSLNRATQESMNRMHNHFRNLKIPSGSNNQTASDGTSSSSTSGSSYVDDGYDKSLQERRQAAARQRQKEQSKKAQRAAEHQAWLESRRAAQAEAARRAAEKRRLEEERRRAEQRRRYNEAYANEIRQSEARYGSLHNQVTYKATEGYNRMINAQPEGTERMQSGYVPSSINVAKADIASIIPKHSSGYTVSLTLTGNERSSLNSSDYDKAMDDYFFRHQIKEIPKYDPEFWKKTKPAFDEQLPTQLASFIDDGQQAFFKYIMRKNNGKELPIYEGVDEKGRFVFCSDDKHKIFLISKEDATIHILTIENHFGEDENVVAAMSRGSFKDQVKVSGRYNRGGYLGEEGNIYNKKKTLIEEKKDDKEAGDDKQREEKDNMSDNIKKMLIPQAEGKLVLNLRDNSLKWTEESYSVGQQSTLAGSKLNVSFVGGTKGEVSGGEKVEVTASGSVSLSSGIKGGVSVSGSVFSVGVEGNGGLIVGIGNKYYMAVGNVGGSVNAGVEVGSKIGVQWNKKISAEAEAKIGVAKIKIGGTILECLNCAEHNRSGEQLGDEIGGGR